MELDVHITIEVIRGGFILHYPDQLSDTTVQRREIFTSQRKLNQKLKEVLDNFSTTPADTGKAD